MMPHPKHVLSALHTCNEVKKAMCGSSNDNNNNNHNNSNNNYDNDNNNNKNNKILSNIIIIKKNKNKNTDLWRVNQMMNDKTMMNSCTEDNCSGREPNYAS